VIGRSFDFAFKKHDQKIAASFHSTAPVASAPSACRVSWRVMRGDGGNPYFRWFVGK